MSIARERRCWSPTTTCSPYSPSTPTRCTSTPSTGAAPSSARISVVSTYTLALLIGMSVSDVSQKAIANLGMDEVRFTAPVFAGDTLYAESEVLAKRESKSRPGQGIVTIRTLGKNQRGETVCSFRRDMLIPARGQSVEDRLGTY